MFDPANDMTIDESESRISREVTSIPDRTPPTSSCSRERALEAIDQEVLPPLKNDQNLGFQRITALRGIDLHKITSRPELIRELQKNIPTNEFGLFQFLYRSDLLDHNAFRMTEEQNQLDDMLTAARVYLSYDQGFPTLPSGLPVWTQLPDETKEAYNGFLAYLELTGVRVLTSNLVDPILSAEWLPSYYWTFRARSYDMFRAAHHTRMREDRIIKTENCHFLESERMLTAVINALQGEKLDELHKLPVEDLVVLLEKLSKVQRVALGLPAMGAPTTPRTVQIPDVSLTLRQMTAEMRESTPERDEGEEVFEGLHENPDALAAAQELILKIGYRDSK